MSSSTTGSGGPHILAYPYSDSGHIIPLLDLTHRLLARGLTVTVLVTPDSLPLLQPLLSTYPSSIQPLVLSAPPGKTRVAKVNAMSQLYYPILLQWFRSHPSPPVAIISDYFLGWTHHLACELGVRRLVFSPSGAFGFSVLLSLWRDLPKLDMGSPLSFPQIPHSPLFPWRQISHYYRNGKEGDPDWESNRTNLLDDIASWGVVFNSFAELERVYLEHTRDELGHDRVWAVGPLLPSEDSVVGPANRGGPSSLPCHEVMTWLGARHDSSVVYVCFGSRFSLPRKQMDALAEALECSGVQFILCVRRHVGDDDDKEGAIPDGFEDRVEGRGLVIKGWAPQVAILSHRAVGAFLTHCGWNSVLEGLAAGVVMLTWPLGADQFTNAKLLVEQLGVGIRAGEDTENIPESTELARLLAESVAETECFSRHSKDVLLKLKITGIVFSSFLSILAVFALYRIYSYDKVEKENQAKIKTFLEDYKNFKPTRYSYADIKRITNQFVEKLGEGAYGTVFKGKLSNEIHVAVKMIMNTSKENGEEFINEVGTMGRIHHVNVVRMVGFCADGFRRALVYEFLPNYSLEKFISSVDTKNRFLGWDKLQDIAIGIAKGIDYLHQGCDQQILHFDIKPHNVLLDENFNPKISDFGLAKLCSKDQSAVSMTAARGTMGYIAPEVFSRNFGNVSYKSDIYSYGILLLEVVGGRKNVDITAKNTNQVVYFPEWIYNFLEQKEDLRVFIENDEDAEIAKKLAIIGLWCIQWHPTDRPSMKVVIQMLEGGHEPTMPPNPFASTNPTRMKLNQELDVILEQE